ncbi:hypothetical protein LCGC14_2629300, partial [marine sediment metagenome]
IARWEAASVLGRSEAFFTSTVSDIGGYETLGLSPQTGAGDDDSISIGSGDGETLIEAYAVAPNIPALTSWEAGNWTFELFGYVDSVVGVSELGVKVYHRTDPGGSETLILETWSGEINDTSSALQTFRYTETSDTATAITDRLVVKIYARTTSVPDRTIHFQHGGNLTASHIETPLLFVDPTLMYGSTITNHAIPRGDGGARTLQDSGVVIDDSDNVTGIAALTAAGALSITGGTASLGVDNAVVGAMHVYGGPVGGPPAIGGALHLYLDDDYDTGIDFYRIAPDANAALLIGPDTNVDFIVIDGTKVDVDGEIEGNILDINGQSDLVHPVFLVKTDDDVNGPAMHWQHNTASPANDDLAGQLQFWATDDAPALVNICDMRATATDVATGDMDAAIEFHIMTGGVAKAKRLTVDGTGIVVVGEIEGATLDINGAADILTSLEIGGTTAQDLLHFSG